jgi:hypothetical protein
MNVDEANKITSFDEFLDLLADVQQNNKKS